MDLTTMRQEYESLGIEPDRLAVDPMEQLLAWLSDAAKAEVAEPNAMVLASVDSNGIPRSRYVLAKSVTSEGIDFYTNYDSMKGTEIGDHNLIAATFGWLDLHRQVNLVGTASKMTSQQSDDYFASRPRASQLGAWASHQSRVISDRMVLDHAFDAADERFPTSVPRPPYWGGYRIVPTSVEFWQGRRNRLHDRVRYRIVNTTEWYRERLSP